MSDTQEHAETDIIVRENRQPGYYWLDNEVLDEFGIKVGAYGIAVYNVLARNVYDRGNCSLSVRKIAEMLDISKSTVSDSVDRLALYHLITILPPEKGSNAPSTYYLLKIKTCPPNGHPPCPPNGQVDETCPPHGTGCPPNGQGVRLMDTNKERRSSEEERKNKPEGEGAGFKLTGNKDKNPPQKIKSPPDVFVLPDWIPQDAWDGYVEMRKQIKKPMTDRAKKLAIKELEKLDDEGHSPEAVLNQSVMNCWQGLFAPKNGNGNRDHPKQWRNTRTGEVFG